MRLLGAIPPHIRRRAVVLLTVSGLLFGVYMVWLRDIGLVAVEKVQVTGLTGKDAAKATAALEAAARESTTLHVDRAAIDAVADRFPIIHSVRIETDFPKGMSVAVTEQRPAAMLVAGSRRIPVAGDGSVLTALTIRQSLPTIKVEPGNVPDKRLTPSSTLDAVRVAGGAPAALTPRLQSVTKEGAKGWVVQVEDGPELIFGAATSLAAEVDRGDARAGRPRCGRARTTSTCASPAARRRGACPCRPWRRSPPPTARIRPCRPPPGRPRRPRRRSSRRPPPAVGDPDPRSGRARSGNAGGGALSLQPSTSGRDFGQLSTSGRASECRIRCEVC